MNAFVSTLSRDLVCASAAVVITMVVAGSIVQSTSVPPGMHAFGRHTTQGFIALQPRDGWFGQPEPAVLVD